MRGLENELNAVKDLVDSAAEAAQEMKDSEAAEKLVQLSLQAPKFQRTFSRLQALQHKASEQFLKSHSGAMGALKEGVDEIGDAMLEQKVVAF